MKRDSPFRDFDLSTPQMVSVQFEGKELLLPQGMNLAAALLRSGITVFRYTPVCGVPRGPFCMMGACFDCLIDQEGIVQQACMLTVSEGMILAKPTRNIA